MSFNDAEHLSNTGTIIEVTFNDVKKCKLFSKWTYQDFVIILHFWHKLSSWRGFAEIAKRRLLIGSDVEMLNMNH
jgi:hypothetical protein